MTDYMIVAVHPLLARAIAYWTGHSWSKRSQDAKIYGSYRDAQKDDDSPAMDALPPPAGSTDVSIRPALKKQDWSTRRPEMGGVRNRDHSSPAIYAELDDAARRAHEAGAPEELDFVGAGMYGIVFCDAAGKAWKVGRLETPGASRDFMREALATEYEWLRDAADSPLASNIVKVYGFHPDPMVIERECVPGSHGTPMKGTELWKLHKRIEASMIPLGWTSPEFKENSYIIREDGTPVLVDASGPLRIGHNLVGFIEDVLAGRRHTRDRWHDLAFYLMPELRDKVVPEVRVRALLDRLVELDPEIRKSFRF